MLNCPEEGALVEQEIDRVLTQYRESPKLLHVLRTDLRLIEETILATCAVPSFFDIESAVGDQLTLIGKRMGWPRCHCTCTIQPIFGFECEGYANQGQTIVGFCDENGTWADCGPFGVSEVCITNDEVYRGFLMARRYQMMAMYDLDSLTAAVRHLLGDQAQIISAGNGRIVVAPGRALTASEQALLQLYPRVLPVAPGIQVRFHFGPLRVFGFGEGFGGLCEPYAPNGVAITTETGAIITVPTGEQALVPISAGDNQVLATDEGDYISALVDVEALLMTGPLTRSAPFICPVDVHPYDCG